MARIYQGILGVFAVVAGLGAVQLALGNDLDPRGAQSAESVVNRDAKSDRTVTSRLVAEGRTIAVRLDESSNSSILVRVAPLDRIAPVDEPRRAPSILIAPSASRKPVVACEPMVSVLTDVVKQLQPGRCLT
jgi:hypothetical protein